MKKELSIKFLTSLHTLSAFHQTLIKGGAGDCGCSEEKKRTIKVKKADTLIVDTPITSNIGISIVKAPILNSPVLAVKSLT